MKNPPDFTGETPFDLAKKNGFEAICDLVYNECRFSMSHYMDVLQFCDENYLLHQLELIVHVP